MLSKLLVVKNWGYFVKISMGHFHIFSVGLDVNLQSMTGHESRGSRKTGLARQRVLGIINAPPNSKSCWDLCRFRWAKIASKVHLALFLLFACTVTVFVGEENFQGENSEKFSQQNGPSYTYEIDTVSNLK